eukprot:CAMPEP_0172774170 /NCGR_PEP_ID=MMETSP1074-20121228/195671_1 /TAXON_ID=2916 /ORGANISM="Ceratium fusus, Strain PA161109" /LENGTH=49 /DNA_ID= /DNA_START= /DNA_END= /DNA_ORIENTATION=
MTTSSSKNPSEGNEQEHGCLYMRFITATAMTEDPFENFDFDGIMGLGLN